MAFTLRQQKEIESDIHNQLYTNILILTMEYPTTIEFNACFKEDMFVKSNKLAFQHIVHFLLNVLDAEQFKQRIIWPILDTRMETQFRNEVMKFLNEVNSVNKDTGVPLIMTSHLISPGGFKFADFMFRLSQFVLSEHIKRDSNMSDSVTYPPKADKDYVISSQQVQIYNKIVDDQYCGLAKKQVEFNAKFRKAKLIAAHIIENKPIVEKHIIDIQKEAHCLFESTPTCNAELSVVEREEIVEQKLDKLSKTILLFKTCSELIDVLNKSHETDSNCSKNSSSDLIQYFKSFLVLLKNNKYMIKERKDHHLPEHLTITKQIFEDLSLCNDKYEELKTNLRIYCSQLEYTIQNYSYDKSHPNVELSKRIQEIFEKSQ